MTTVALADVAVVVEFARIFPAKLGVDFFGTSDELRLVLKKWENSIFNRGQIWMKLENSAVVAFFVFFYGVGITKNSKKEPTETHRSLKNPRDVFLTGYWVGIMKVGTREFLVLSEIVIAAVVNTHELIVAATWVVVLNIPSVFGVEDEVFVLVPVKVFLLNTKTKEPVPLLFLDALVVIFVFAGLNEILSVGLFELAAAEEEIAGGDFVAEGFADLGNTKRNFNSASIEDVFVVEVNTLTGLTWKVGGLGVLLGEIAKI